jgi:hypothetical protein
MAPWFKHNNTGSGDLQIFFIFIRARKMVLPENGQVSATGKRALGA